MSKYTCDNHQPIAAESMKEAAEQFAERKAKAEYGKRGRVGAIRQDCHAQNGSFAEYEAFIGHPCGVNSSTGHNVRFTVHAAQPVRWEKQP